MSRVYDFYLFAFSGSDGICIDHYRGSLDDYIDNEDDEYCTSVAYDYFIEKYPYITGDLFEDDEDDYIAVVSDETDNDIIEYDKYLLVRRPYKPASENEYSHYYIAGDTTCSGSYRGEDICIDTFNGAKADADKYFYDKYYSGQYDYNWYNKYSKEVKGASVAYCRYAGGRDFPFEKKFESLKREIYRDAYIVRIGNF